MALLPLRSPHAMEALPCPPWQDHTHQHNSNHPYSPHYSTEMPPGSISTLHLHADGRYIPVSPPIDALPMTTTCHPVEVNTACTLPRLPVTVTQSQPEIALHPAHNRGRQCAVLETSFIESSCPPVGCVYMCVCMCVCVCVCTCMCTCIHMCVFVCALHPSLLSCITVSFHKYKVCVVNGCFMCLHTYSFS